MTTETARPTLVAFCPECRLGVEPYRPGMSCESGCEVQSGSFRKYRKRLLYPCRECDGYYFSALELRNHIHGDWEQGVI